MKIKQLAVIFLVVAGGALLHGQEPVRPPLVHFDRVAVPSEEIVFEDDVSRPRPNISVFTVTWSAFMTSDTGERYALVTFAHGQLNPVILNTRDVIAIFADGSRAQPVKLDGERQIEGRGTVMLHFGPHRFPIVKVETRN